MRGIVRLAIVLLLLGTGALLAPRAMAADSCDGATATQLDLDRCADRQYRAADRALNAAYKALSEKLAAEPATRALLQRAERAWVAFRDAECAFATSASVGGSIQPMEWSLCLAGVTETRTAQLKRQIDCPEGDLTCVR
jgi:uncharacterized protein YecT (DUF1311 family)